MADVDEQHENKPPDKTGKRPPIVELERRISFVEQLVILGKAQSPLQVQALISQVLHVDVSEHTARNYTNAARERLKEEDAEVRKIRREALARRELQIITDMSESLKSNRVIPTWGDFLAFMKMVKDGYSDHKRVDFEADEKPVVEADAPETKTSPELEKLMVELLDAASRG